MHEFEDREFANVSKEDLKLGDKGADEKAKEKKVKVRALVWRWHAVMWR